MPEQYSKYVANVLQNSKGGGFLVSLQKRFHMFLHTTSVKRLPHHWLNVETF